MKSKGTTDKFKLPVCYAKIDDLWNRIGGKFKSKGVTPSTITKAIKASRKSQ